MKKENYNIKNGSELESLLRDELNPIFSTRYFHIDYNTIPYKRLSIVLYNADKRASQYIISLSGNIALQITGFDDQDNISSYMVLNCLKEREIGILMQIKNQSGNIDSIIAYLLKKFKHLNLEKVTDSTKHMKFDEIAKEEIPIQIEPEIIDEIPIQIESEIIIKKDDEIPIPKIINKNDDIERAMKIINRNKEIKLVNKIF